MAVVALTSCAESEVLDIPESKLIGFDTHVDKPTRALATDVLTANLNGFYVYADYGEGEVDEMNDFDPKGTNYLKNEKVYNFKKFVINFFHSSRFPFFFSHSRRLKKEKMYQNRKRESVLPLSVYKSMENQSYGLNSLNVI